MPIEPKRSVIYVSNMECSVHFYRILLGIAPAVESEQQVEFTPDGILLVLRQANQPALVGQPKPALTGHPAGSSSLQLAVPDLEAICSNLRLAGIVVEGPIEKDELAPHAFMQDPDGYSIEMEQSEFPVTPEMPSVSPQEVVSLREITAETLRGIIRLSDTLRPTQKQMVAPNAVSIAQAHFSPFAWFRGIYAGDAPVGFVMVYIGPEDDADPHTKTVYFLWRFMIAGPYQGMGFGRRALELIVEEVKQRGGKRLGVSCGQGEGSPEGFYKSLGFVRDGQMYGDEIGLVLNWD